MFAPRLGDVVRIKGTPVRGVWKRWNSRTERVVVIDEDGVVYQTYRKSLVGERIMHNIGDSVIRTGQVNLPANIGRIMTVHPYALTVVLPSGKTETHPTAEWARATTESSVELKRGENGKIEFVGEWQGGTPVFDTRTQEQKNIDEFATVADLRANGETVEVYVDPDADDDPSWEDQMSEILGEDTFEDSEAPAELPAAEDLPPGNPLGDDAVERIMNADATAPAPKTTEEIAELKRQWLPDPHWDIEETEGFEAHHSELKQWADEQRAEWKKSAQPAGDDLVNILDMLRRRIVQLEDDHMDTLALIAALPSNRAAAPARVETTTIWQDDIQDPLARASADAHLATMRNAGWSVVHEAHVVHPVNHTCTRIIRLERPQTETQPGQRAAAEARQPVPPPTAPAYIQQPEGDRVTVVMHPSPAREIPVREAAPRGVAAPVNHLILPLRSADGRRLPTLDELDAEVFAVANGAVAQFRAANPPPVFTPFPSALPAGQ